MEHEQEILQEDFWKELNYKPQEFRQHKLSDGYCPKDDFKEYMEKISKKMHASCGLRTYILENLLLIHQLTPVQYSA